MSRRGGTFKYYPMAQNARILPNRSTDGNSKKVNRMRRAKIVCTLGPASSEPAFIGHLVEEGMNVARINFSHGEREDHAKIVAAVRQEAERRARPVAILQDLQGPKIRVRRFAQGAVELEPGADF